MNNPVKVCPFCGVRVLRVSTDEGDTLDLDLPPVPPVSPGLLWVLRDLRTAWPVDPDDDMALVRWRAHRDTCPAREAARR